MARRSNKTIRRRNVFTTPDKETVFKFLDNLRASGAINMFGAAPVINEHFECGQVKARALLTEWMQTFAQRHAVAK